jgi:hypothetical protein
MWGLGMASITFVVSFLMKLIKLENLCIKSQDKSYKKNAFGGNDPYLSRNLLNDDKDDIDRALEVEMAHMGGASSAQDFFSNPMSS